MPEQIDIELANRLVARWVGFHPERVVVRLGLYDGTGNPVDGKVYDREEDVWQSCPRYDTDPVRSASLREFLRQKGFLVEVKIMPDEFPFRRNDEVGSDLSYRRAWCKLYPIAPAVQWYRHCPLHSFGDTEAEAVLRACYAAMQHYNRARLYLIEHSEYPVSHERMFDETMGLMPLLMEGLEFRIDFLERTDQAQGERR